MVLQLLFTYAPPLQGLFETEAIPLWVWPWLFLGGLVFFLVVEAEKLFLRMSRPARGAPVLTESNRLNQSPPLGDATAEIGTPGIAPGFHADPLPRSGLLDYYRR